MSYGEATYGEAGYGESAPAAALEVAVGQASESNSALPVAPVTPIAVGQASETEAALSVTPLGGYVATVLADSPLAYYRLNETSGTAIADSSGNGRHGTASASVVSAASLIADPTDKSIDFNKNNRVSVPNAAWMDVLTFSAEVWINADGTNSAQGLIVGRANDSGGGGDSRRSFKITTHGSGQAITYLLRFTNNTFLEATTNTAIFGVTSHIVLTWDGTWARLYKNGVEIHSTNAHAGKTLGFPAQPLTIGQDAGGFSTTRADARIDEVAYYGHALTPERVLAHYNTGAPPQIVALGQALETGSALSITPAAGLGGLGYESTILEDSPLGYWKLGESTGTVAEDSSGNDHDGTYAFVGNLTYGVPSLVETATGTAIAITGGSGRMIVPAAAWMNVPQFSIEAWASRDGGSGSQAVVSRADYGSGFGSTWTFLLNTLDSGSFEVGAFTSSGNRISSGVGSWTLGEPFHVVLTYDGSAVRFYVDGELVWTSASLTGTPNGNLSIDLIVGGEDDGRYSNFVGRVDEVAYYDTALSDARVLAHHNAGAVTQTIVIGQASESDSALSITTTPATVVPVGQAAETDTTLSIIPSTSAVVVVGQAAETDLAQGIIPFSPVLVIPVGQATEVDSANPIAGSAPVLKILGIGLETDTAFPIQPTSGYVLVDDYNRANSTNVPGTPIAGGPYTVRTGTWGINNNALYTSASTSEAHMTFPGSADFDARLKLDVPGSNGGLLFRWVDTNNCWLVQWNPTQLILHRRVAGTYAQMSPTFTRTLTPTDELRVVAFGAFIWVFLNDVLMITLYDGFTAGYTASTMGFRFSSSTNTRLNEITVQTAMAPPVSDGTADLANPEAAGADSFNGVLLYKGRDTYLADEGAEA